MYENIELTSSKGKKYQFRAEDLQPVDKISQSGHDIIYTKIMAGTAAVSIGEYQPSEWEFKTHHQYPKNNPYKYNKMIKELHNDMVKVNCPYIGDIYNAYVSITKAPAEGPGWLELSFNLKEIPPITDPLYTRIFNNPNEYGLFEGRKEK